MAIKIDKIKINRGGPIEKDFILDSGDVNLIYGHNETGKTYIVESIISLLFRTGRKSTINWNLREWDSSGNISVSGLQDKPLPFTKTSKKLEDYWDEEIGLPQDFSRLLVVKAGETLLSHEVDGVGRDILKNYLSGEGLLDEIEGDISSTILKAKVQNREIIGPSQGELKRRGQCRDELNQIDSLLEETGEVYASGEVHLLRQKQEALKEQLELQNKAKRYHASLLHKKRDEKQLEIGKLPSEEELSKIESDISVYEANKTVVERKSDKLSKMESTADDYRWTEKALEIYRELSVKSSKPPKSANVILVFIFLIGAVITGILKLTVPFIISAAGLLVFFILYFAGTRKAFTTIGDSIELEKLKEEYKTRYDSELTDRAALEARLETLKENYISAKDLRKDLEENLIPELKTGENNLRMSLKMFTGTDLSPKEWRPVISEIRARVNKLGKEISSLDLELTSLAVPEENFLEQDPGIEWNSNIYNSLDKELTETSAMLNQNLQKLEQLKSRVSQETGSGSSDWEELITALQDKREKTAQYYRQITAEILAKVQVSTIIQEYREEENTRISDGLESEELTKPLYAVTGRYKKIRHEMDSGLVLTTDEDDEYPLSEISTGAREQVFLALRMGFSSIVMKGQPAFLILDDAFQHSDWPRRENLVDQILGLAINGWQIFYFTMDDHIRDLFLKGGENLGGNFQSTELL